jgi:hypothetical protein
MNSRRLRQKMRIVLGRLALGIAVGLALGAGSWTADLIGRGQSIMRAARGQVDDAIPTLQAILALSGMCGAAVGLLAGLRALASAGDRQSERGGEAERPPD